MVTFVDRERVWLKSVVGLPGLKEVQRRHSLCAWVLLSRYPSALVVPDLTKDARFAVSAFSFLFVCLFVDCVLVVCCIEV